MADFQSFLFQSMNAIGLNEEAKKLASNEHNGQVYNSKIIDDCISDYNVIDEPKPFRRHQTNNKNNINNNNNESPLSLNRNLTSSTLKTEIANIEAPPFSTTNKPSNLAQNSNFYNPSQVKHSSNFTSSSSSGSESITSSSLPCSSGNFNINSNFKTINDYEIDIEQNCSIIRSDSLSDVKKLTDAAFKSSSPVVLVAVNNVEPKLALKHDLKSRKFSIKSQDTERGVTSPKFLRKNANLNNSTISSRIENSREVRKKKADKYLEDLNETEYNRSEKNDLDEYHVRSGFFNKKNLSLSSSSSSTESEEAATDVEYKKKSNTSLKTEENDIEKSISLIIEPLVKKEILNQSSTLSRSSKIVDLTSNPSLIKEIIKKIKEKYENENEASDTRTKDQENFNAKKTKSRSSSAQTETEDDEEEDEEEDFELNNLRELSKSKIPWHNLNKKSVDLLFQSVKNKDADYPVLFSKNDHKISQSQVKKWYKILEHIYEKEIVSDTCHKKIKKSYKKKDENAKKSPIASSLSSISKKSESSSFIGSPKSISKLYTNVLKVKNKAISNFRSHDHKKNSSNLDHLYNEINDSENAKNHSKSGCSSHSKTNRTIEEKVNLNASNFNMDDIESSIMQNVNFRRTLSNLKSPERQILYNDWFKIVKKMDKDPKFDLEALIRTKGRFTDHEQIAYRDKLVKTRKCLKTCQSEPIMSKAKTDELNIKTNPNSSSSSSTNKNSTIGSAVSKAKNWERELDETLINNNNKNNATSRSNKKEDPNSSFKLTLEKSDINYIKEILNNKKPKLHVMNELSKLNEAKTNKSSASKSSKHHRSHVESEEFSLDEDENQSKLEHNEESEQEAKNGSKSKSRPRKDNRENVHSASKRSNRSNDSGHNHEKEGHSNLMSKCKNNFYKSSDAAKQMFKDEMNKIKGSIESKLKHLTNHSPKIHNELFDDDDNEEEPSRKEHNHRKKSEHENEQKPAKSKANRSKPQTEVKESSKPPPPKRPPPPKPSTSPTRANYLNKSSSASCNNLKSNCRDTVSKTKGKLRDYSESPAVHMRTRKPPLPPRSKHPHDAEHTRLETESDIYDLKEMNRLVKDFSFETNCNQRKYNKNVKMISNKHTDNSSSTESESACSVASYTKSPALKRRINKLKS